MKPRDMILTQLYRTTVCAGSQGSGTLRPHKGLLMARNAVHASPLHGFVAAKLSIFCLVWFSANSAPCHSTGDKEGKVQELAILSRGEGLENHSSPLNWLALRFFLSFNTFKTGRLTTFCTPWCFPEQGQKS